MDIKTIKKNIEDLALPDNNKQEARGSLCFSLVKILSLKYFCDLWDSLPANSKEIVIGLTKDELKIVEASPDLFTNGVVFTTLRIDLKDLVTNSNRLDSDLIGVVNSLGPYSQDVFTRLKIKTDISDLHSKGLLLPLLQEIIMEDLSKWSKNEIYDLLLGLIHLSYTYVPSDAEDTVTPRDIAELMAKMIDSSRFQKDEPVLVADQTDYSGTLLIAARDYLESLGFTVSVFSYGKTNDLARLMLLVKYGQDKVTVEASLDVNEKQGKYGAYNLNPKDVPNRFDVILIDQPQTVLQSPMWYQLRKLLSPKGQMICLANGSPLYTNDPLPKVKKKDNPKGPLVQLVEEGFLKKVCLLGKDVSYSTNIDQYLVLIDNLGADPKRNILIQNISSFRDSVKHIFDNKKQEFSAQRIGDILALDSLPPVQKVSLSISPSEILTQEWKIVKQNGEKDTEITPYSRDEKELKENLKNHLEKWGVGLGSKSPEKGQVRATISFNKLFYENPESRTVEEIELELDNINNTLYNLDKALKAERK